MSLLKIFLMTDVGCLAKNQSLRQSCKPAYACALPTSTPQPAPGPPHSPCSSHLGAFSSPGVPQTLQPWSLCCLRCLGISSTSIHRLCSACLGPQLEFHALILQGDDRSLWYSLHSPQALHSAFTALSHFVILYWSVHLHPVFPREPGIVAVFNPQFYHQYPQFSSVAQLFQLFATPWTAAHHTSLSITNSHSVPKLMSIESMMPSNHLILCRSLLLLPLIPPSIRVFSCESALCIRWPKYWNFSFSISLSNEHPGLISFRMDWLDLLAVQWTHNSLFQHHSSKASILWRSAFFTVQLSHPYMTTGKP